MLSSTRLLKRPAPRSVKDIALNLTKKALKRLKKLDDDESLHEIRIVIRKLRTHLKAYRYYVDDRVKTHQKKLARLMTISNSSRDAAVHKAWLEEKLKKRLAKLERLGLDQLLHNYPEAKAEDLSRFKEGLKSELQALEKQLERKVKVKKNSLVFAEVSGALLAQYLEQYKAQLNDLKSADDPMLHRTRLTLKKARYSLESLNLPEAETSLKMLKTQQDILGHIHDLQTLEPHLRDTLKQAASTWLDDLFESHQAKSEFSEEMRALFAAGELIQQEKQQLFNTFMQKSNVVLVDLLNEVVQILKAVPVNKSQTKKP